MLIIPGLKITVVAVYRLKVWNYSLLHATDGTALMLEKSSEAYGEKRYKLGNHLFYTMGMERCFLVSMLNFP
jgi:hypothetical protein